MSISPEPNKPIKISISPFNPLANDAISIIKIAGQEKDTTLPAHKRRLIHRSTKFARHHKIHKIAFN